MARRLPPRVSPSPSKNRSCSPSREGSPSPASALEPAAGAGAHLPRSSKHRATADETTSPLRAHARRAGRRSTKPMRRPRSVSGAGDRGGAALAVQNEPVAVDDASTLPVARRRTVTAEYHDRGPGAGAHPTRSCQRRATADEAKNPR